MPAFTNNVCPDPRHAIRGFYQLKHRSLKLLNFSINVYAHEVPCDLNYIKSFGFRDHFYSFTICAPLRVTSYAIHRMLVISSLVSGNFCFLFWLSLLNSYYSCQNRKILRCVCIYWQPLYIKFFELQCTC